MRVLLTGAAGFIGGAIRRELDAAGHEVVLVDVLLPQAHRVPPVVDGLHVLDVRDAADWADLLDGIDVVCHQAALVGAGTTVADLPEYAAHNDLGTAALLAAMSARDVRRLVLASSMVVYGEGRYVCPTHGAVSPPARSVAALESGDFDNHCPTCGEALGWELVDESARLDPRSSYAAGKVAQEHYTSAWARQGDAAAVALRYHNVYGPGMPRDTPYSGVAAIFRSSLERGEAPRVFEDGAQMRDFVHVADVARANLAAIEDVGRRGTGAHDGVQRLLRLARLDPRRGPDPRRHRPRARRHRAVPRRRRPPRRRLARQGDRRARLHRRHHAPSRGWPSSPPLRCATDHQPVASRCCTTRATTTWRPRPQRRHRSGSRAQPISSQGTNGSQIRSTSARLIWERSAATTMAVPAATSHHTTRVAAVGRRASVWATPAKASGPALKARAARLPHIQYSGGRLWATPSQYRSRSTGSASHQAYPNGTYASTTARAASAAGTIGRHDRATTSTATASNPSSGRP